MQVSRLPFQPSAKQGQVDLFCHDIPILSIVDAREDQSGEEHLHAARLTVEGEWQAKQSGQNGLTLTGVAHGPPSQLLLGEVVLQTGVSNEGDNQVETLLGLRRRDRPITSELHTEPECAHQLSAQVLVLQARLGARAARSVASPKDSSLEPLVIQPPDARQDAEPTVALLNDRPRGPVHLRVNVPLPGAQIQVPRDHSSSHAGHQRADEMLVVQQAAHRCGQLRTPAGRDASLQIRHRQGGTGIPELPGTRSHRRALRERQRRHGV
mmetsp:Transcript_12231/g.45338  ORF Transcript_12231/g.45338 Transcript_12231/m.45338 type:complete len:267 (-) Transcript_12231:315-1115(-)